MLVYNRKVRSLKGQSTLEYAILIACVAAGLICMQFFVKRAMNGRIRLAGDEIGEQHSVVDTDSKFTERSRSKTEIFPYMYALTDADHSVLKDTSGQELYGIEVDYGVDEKITKSGDEDISGY